MRGTHSKLIFIDSSVNTDGRDHTKLLIPPHPFSAQGGERMALTLVSFTMRRNWYNINATNNTFYLFVSNTHYEVSIAPGVYPTFVTLQGAIYDALTTRVATIAEIQQVTGVTYDAVTRRFSIAIRMDSSHQTTPVEIRCFAIKGGPLPAGVSIQGGFSDVHEILGGTPIRSVGSAANSLAGTLGAGINTLVSKYPASLNTLDAIYLHMNIETGNFMSTGHESHAQESLRLIESSLFARIPFDDSTFTEAHEVVQFEDNGGDMYQSFLSRKTLETLDIRVTDARGRSLSTFNPTQAADGQLGFRMCLRWDLFVPPPVPQPMIRPQLPPPHPPTL